MSSIQALYRRLIKIKASLPPSPKTFSFDVSLLTEQEQAQYSTFMSSLPRRFDVKDLSDTQLDEMRYWFGLEASLERGDTADADRRRRRHGLTLDELIDRFLNLDLSALPTDCNAPGLRVQEDNCIYSYRLGNYRYIVGAIEAGWAERYKDDMWRWVDTLPRLKELVKA